VVTPLVVVFAGLDEFERHGGRTNYPAPSDALPHHATGRDPGTERNSRGRWQIAADVERIRAFQAAA
jgi:hypothetical protein